MRLGHGLKTVGRVSSRGRARQIDLPWVKNDHLSLSERSQISRERLEELMLVPNVKPRGNGRSAVTISSGLSIESIRKI